MRRAKTVASVTKTHAATLVAVVEALQVAVVKVDAAALRRTLATVLVLKVPVLKTVAVQTSCAAKVAAVSVVIAVTQPANAVMTASQRHASTTTLLRPSCHVVATIQWLNGRRSSDRNSSAKAAV
jgi:hypothetical protein